MDKQVEAAAWRWKPKDGVTWFYDPDPEWLEQQGDAVDKEPLFTQAALSAYRAGGEAVGYVLPEDLERLLKFGSPTRLFQKPAIPLPSLDDAVPLFLHPAPAAREALEAAKKVMRNARGAVESGQVTDKDVRGTLKRGEEAIDAALASAPETQGGE